MKRFLIVLFLIAGCGYHGGGADDMARIKLPEPVIEGDMTVEKAISLRRSVRSYSTAGLEMEQISKLLWSAQGITDTARGLRAAPSAGATYPLELYLVDREGVYNYIPSEHALKMVRKGDIRKALSRAALGQGFVAEAPVNVVITAVYERTSGRYGPRAERYVHIEAGHAAQNIHLQAVAMGLASVPVGAFRDEEVKKALGLDEGIEPVYIIPVGKPG